MSQCSDCKQQVEELATRSSKCKPCHRAYTRAHYAANKQYYVDKARKRNDEQIALVRRWVWEHLQDNGCVDCSESDPVVLEFDHKDNVDKQFNVSSYSRKTISLERVQQEVAKCDVRCANCHRRRTAKQQSWWKLTYSL